jgi:hypothetical protein
MGDELERAVDGSGRCLLEALTHSLPQELRKALKT